MFVLGIDPGVSRCGYACVQATKSGPHAVAIGVIRTAKDDPLAVRLAELQAELRGIFDEYRPEVLAIERVLFQKNVRTAMSVGQASGVALAEAAARGMEVVEYSPNEVKLAVAGHGGADKDQMQRMVKTLLGLSAVPKPADAADAAGLALCHLAHRGLQRRIGASASSGKRGRPAPGWAGSVIGSLRGTLIDRSLDGEVVVEVHGTGLGYRIVMGPTAAATIGQVGDEVFVWIHHHIREDAQCLYGFSERSEQRCFEALLGAHGVGPALALAILSVHRPAELARVVSEDDVAALCLVPGVGKKTAARLLIEMQSRLGEEVDAIGHDPGSQPDTHGLLGDVHVALEGLGYRSEEIAQVLRLDGVRDTDDVAVAVRIALKHLGTRS